MRLRIIAAGKIREPHLRAAVNDYVGRLSRYLAVDEIEVKPGKDQRAAKAMLKAIPSRAELWVLDVGGRQPTSAQLAQMIKDRMDHGCPGIAFVLGGPDGLPEQVLAKAACRLSLSKLTLPHRLARLLLAEQLYRALTIIRGEPYAR